LKFTDTKFIQVFGVLKYFVAKVCVVFNYTSLYVVMLVVSKNG